MRFTYLLFCISLFCAVLTANIGSSGGTTDKNCISCHGNTKDTIAGSINVKGFPQQYIPSHIYNLELCVIDTDMITAGFRLDISAGHLILSNQENMVRISSGEATHSGRTLLENDTACWKVDWQAPSYKSSEINLLMQACAANNDLTEKEDHGGYALNYSASIMPVNFGPFIATQSNYLVQLQWTTLTEVANDFFVVERSINHVQWDTVGVVMGSGFSSVDIKYMLTDKVDIGGKYIYRLSQTDYDGNIKYHQDFLSIKIPQEKIAKKVFRIGETIQITERGHASLIDLNGNVLSASTSGGLEVPVTPEGIYLVKIGDYTKKVYIHQ